MRGRDCIWQPTNATGKCRIPLFWRAGRSFRSPGVVDVQSFDEDQVLLETVRGMLVVRGQGLHVERLQLEAGELIVEGKVGLPRRISRQRTAARRFFQPSVRRVNAA